MADKTEARIVELADQMFYEQGFTATSFADIAERLGISRGNFYHHFKSKDAILAAVIARRLAVRRLWLDEWALEGPKAALHRFIDILTTGQDKIMAHGCPVGGLCHELSRLNHPAQPDAQAIAALFIEWIGQQLAALGADSSLALHLFGRSQGVASLGNITKSAEVMAAETAALHRWLDETLEKGA